MTRRIIFIGYFVALHAAVLLLIWHGNVMPRVTARVRGARGETLAEHTDFYRRTLAFHGRSIAAVPGGAVLLMGDSLVQGQCAAAIALQGVNYGICSDTTRGLLSRLETYREGLRRASVVIVAIGFNDLRSIAAEESARNYGEILDRLAPLPVVASAVLPVAESATATLQGLNRKIIAFNEMMAAEAASRPHVLFVNGGSRLDADRDGNLDLRFSEPDGVHLNAEGNAVWAAVLREAVEAALPPAGGGMETSGREERAAAFQ